MLLNESVWASAANGSSFTTLPNSQLGLRYTFSGGSDIPSNWVMNPNTGRMTQAIPGEGTIGTVSGETFEGNLTGTYNITLKITDAQGVDTDNTTNAFEPLVFTQPLTIVLGNPPLNDGIVPATCAVTQPQPSDPVQFPIANLYPNNYQIAPSPIAFSYPTTNVFYVADEPLSYDALAPGFTFPTLGFSDRPQSPYDVPVRVGFANHTQGTIVLTTHIYKPANAGTPTGFALNNIVYSYQVVGEQGWTELIRDQEYNKVGELLPSPEDAGYYPKSYSASIAYDNPYFGEGNFNPFYPAAGSTDAVVGPSNDAIWVKAVRAINYSSLGVSSPVQWKVTIRGLANRPAANAGQRPTVVGWVTVDDLNNPSCVPVQGTNIVDTNMTTNNRYRYKVSVPSSNSTGYVTVDPGQQDLFATTPYGDYVTEFFISSTGEEVYKPSANAPYINFSLNSSFYSPLSIPWTNVSGANVDIQWVAGFSSVTGTRLLSRHH